MERGKQVRISDGLLDVFGRISKDFAAKIKKEYGLTELFVPYSVPSQIVAAKFKGEKTLNFTIKKTGSKKGILKIN